MSTFGTGHKASSLRPEDILTPVEIKAIEARCIKAWAERQVRERTRMRLENEKRRRSETARREAERVIDNAFTRFSNGF